VQEKEELAALPLAANSQVDSCKKLRLRFHRSAVNANIVDQAGEEGAGGVILPDADVQTAAGSFQGTLASFLCLIRLDGAWSSLE
jgi:hypothetical protein